jgi:NAD+ diphosphatase
MSARRPSPLPFVAPGLDRAAPLRVDDATTRQARAAPTTRLIAVGDAQSVRLDGDARLARVPVSDAPDDAELTLLGREPGGGFLFAYDAADEPLAPLREIALGLDAGEAALAAHAVAIIGWHRAHRHCGRCGAPTELREAGHVRVCPGCGTRQFPRTDPAVIMLVVAGDRCVLSRRPGAPAGRWSALAGFVEPGETPEAAVVREVCEEVGLSVGDVRYQGAQPWPFPSALMLGFRATLDDGAGDELCVDGSELDDARWFTRAELAAEWRAGRIDLPPELSLGHRLVRDWIEEA